MSKIKNALFISVILMCIFCINVQIYAFSDIKDATMNASVDTLSKFKIINGYPDDTFKPDDNITRAEFSKIIISATQNESKTPGSTKFSDITDTYWAKDFIYIAKTLGIVDGTSSDTFSPEDNITYAQAIKMTVAALGYDTEASQMGGWPEGYLKVAKNLNILEGVSYENSAKATRGNIAIIVRNALEVPFYFLVQDGDKIIREKSEKTLFELHSIATEYENNINDQQVADDPSEAVG